MSELDELRREAEALTQSLASRGLEPGFIGGFAVAVCVDRYREELELLDELHPLALAAHPRPTNDLDLVLSERESVRFEEAISADGFVRDTRVTAPPSRFRNGRIAIDAIVVSSEPSARRGFPDVIEAVRAVEATGDAFETVGETTSTTRFARPWALVVLKAVAYGHRFEERDLVDVGRLALVGLEEPRIRADLVRHWDGLPPAIQATVRDLRGQFRTRDAKGPNRFVVNARATWPRLGHDAELEDAVRETVVDAVASLLGNLDER